MGKNVSISKLTSKMEGFVNVKPVIKRITFPVRGKMMVDFQDGRSVSVPISLFPSIRKLSELQRKRYQIIGGEGFTFPDCDEVFHIEQLFGAYSSYRHY